MTTADACLCQETCKVGWCECSTQAMCQVKCACQQQQIAVGNMIPAQMARKLHSHKPQAHIRLQSAAKPVWLRQLLYKAINHNVVAWRAGQPSMHPKYPKLPHWYAHTRCKCHFSQTHQQLLLGDLHVVLLAGAPFFCRGASCRGPTLEHGQVPVHVRRQLESSVLLQLRSSLCCLRSLLSVRNQGVQAGRCISTEQPCQGERSCPFKQMQDLGVQACLEGQLLHPCSLTKVIAIAQGEYPR